MTHYRCDDDGEPVCRPDIYPNDPNMVCASGETQLTDSTVTSWNSLGSCNAQRFVSPFLNFL